MRFQYVLLFSVYKLIITKKQRKGITLVSLVVTIIVLLILAGITINLIIGEDGIIRRAQEAGKNYIDAAENEKLQLGIFENEMDNIIGGSTNSGRTPYDSKFRNNVVAAINREGVETLETDTDEIIIGNIGKIFEEKTKIDSEVAATAENITQGKQAYVNGELVIGKGEDIEYVTGTVPVAQTNGGSIGATVNLGFRPDIICYYNITPNNDMHFIYYNGLENKNVYIKDITQYNIGDNGYVNNRFALYSVNDNGFSIWGTYGAGINAKYIAIKCSNID